MLQAGAIIARVYENRAGVSTTTELSLVQKPTVSAVYKLYVRTVSRAFEPWLSASTNVCMGCVARSQDWMGLQTIGGLEHSLVVRRAESNSILLIFIFLSQFACRMLIPGKSDVFETFIPSQKEITRIVQYIETRSHFLRR